MISQIYTYMGELFHLRYLHGSGSAKIGTYDRTKALKFGMKTRKDGLLPYLKEVRRGLWDRKDSSILYDDNISSPASVFFRGINLC